MQEKIHTRLIALAVTLSVIFGGVLLSPTSVFAQRAYAADDTQDGAIVLTTTAHDQDSSVPENWVNWTGESVAVTAGFNISGSDVNYPNAKFIVSVKKSDFIGEPLIIDSAQAASSNRTDTDENYVIEYLYSTLVGGTAQKVKLAIPWKNRITPDGTVTPIEARLVDQDGNDILTPQRQEAMAKAVTEYSINKYVSPDYDQVYGRNATLKVGEYWNVFDIPTENHSQATRIEQLDPDRDLLPVHYTLEMNEVEGQDGRPRELGFYSAKTFTLTDHLPQGASLSQESIKEGWVYDPITHTATKVLTIGGAPSYRMATRERIILDFHTGDIKDGENVKVYTNRFTMRAEAPTIDPIELPEVSALVGFNATPIATFGGGNAIVEMNKAVDASISNDGYLTSYGNYGQLYNYDNGTLERMWPSAFGIARPHDDFWDKDGNFNDPLKVEWKLWVNQQNNGSSLDGPKQGGFTDTLTEIVDERLAPELYYTSAYVTIPKMSATDMLLPEVTDPADTPAGRVAQSREAAIARVNAAKPIIYGVKADGTEVALTEEPLKLFDTRRHYQKQDGYRVWINDVDKQYTSIKLKFTNPLVMDNFSVHMVVEAWPLPSEMDKWANKAFADQGNRKGYDNWMSAHLYRTGHPDQITTPVREKSMLDNTITIQLSEKRRGMSARIFDKPKLGEPQDWATERTVPYINCEQKALPPEECGRVRVFAINDTPITGGGSLPSELQNYRRVVLLPPGVEYRGLTDWPSADKNRQAEPKLVANYKGTGKNALIFDYGTVTRIPRHYFLLDTTVAAASAPAKNEIQFFETWSNNDQILPDMTPYDNQDGLKNQPDELDLDDDGDTTEPVLMQPLYVSLIAPDENITEKAISVDGVLWYRHMPSQGVGTHFHYRVQVTNSTEVSRNKMEILDVLPAKNDVKIAPNAQGVYLPRPWTLPVNGQNVNQQSSTFVTPLTGPVVRAEAIRQGELSDPSDRFDYFYSLTPQAGNTTNIINGEWKTADQITDWSQVTAFKAVLKEGSSILDRETIRFILPAVIPDTLENRALPNHYRAVNSVATRSQSASFIEGNEATIGIAKFTVEGIVFADLAGTRPNGHVEDGEKRLPGYTVQLLDAATGEVVTDNGTPYETVTDKDGHYSFTVYKPGKYQVRFTKNSEQEKFTTGDGKRSLYWTWTDQVIDHVEVMDGRFGSTESFALNADNDHKIRNAGLIDIPSPTIRVIKVDEDDQNIRLDGASFTLRSNQGEESKSWHRTTRDGGIATFSELTAGEYCLTENSAPDGYMRSDEEKCVTITDEVKVTEVVFTNEKTSGTVKFTKRSDSYEPLPGATFGLYEIDEDGQPKAEPFAQATSDDRGIVRFRKLPIGKYRLQEISAPVGYELSTSYEDLEITEWRPAPDVLEFNFINYKKPEDTPPQPSGPVKLTVIHSIYMMDEEGNVESFPVPADMIFTSTVEGVQDVPSVTIPQGESNGEKTIIEEIPLGTSYRLTVTRPEPPAGYEWVDEEPSQTEDIENMQQDEWRYFTWQLRKKSNPPEKPTDPPTGEPNKPNDPVNPDPNKPNDPVSPDPNKPNDPNTPPPNKPWWPWWPFPWTPGVPNDPEKPQEPTPGTPGVPSDPNPGEPRQPEPGKPGTPGTPAEPEPGTSPEPGSAAERPNPKAPIKRLPSTGFNSALGGLAGLALTVGSVLIAARRRRG